LEIEKLTYSYEDGTVALKDVSLSLEDGERVAVIGPNGAGKSTLLHLIAGFRTPFTGDVRVHGRSLDPDSAKAVRRDIGLLFQDPDDQLFMPTVEEDVAFGPMNLGLDDVGGRVAKAMRGAGVESLAKRRPHRLSHGMKKRVAIAGILAMDPRVLLLDEPTSGLDPRSRADLVSLLKGTRKTMLMATHDLDAVAEVVDRVLVLNVSPMAEGRLGDLAAMGRVLEDAGLEPPQLTRLFMTLKDMGFEADNLPTTMDQAVAQTVRMLERERRKE
jgi:cobalt/nickel transport system ATP-binding protein